MGPDRNADKVSPATPTQIGKYRLIELVGRGAMGKVYAAYDDDTDRQVAIKVLMTDLESEPELRARFFREAQAAARLGHPNVITVYQVGEDEGRPFIVMELLRGSTLETYLRQTGAVDLETRIGMMIQVCDAMAAAHAAGIIHRDLKPGNLFIELDGQLKVLDFGVARLASSSMTSAGAQPGTLQFMSPEQARGENIDHRSDIFSAGGVFYFMLTGRKPFYKAEWAAVLRMLQFENPVALSPKEAPPELAIIVSRMLAKDVAARYQNFHGVAADLTRFQRLYDAETRRLLGSVSVTYDAVLTALESARTAAAAAGESVPPTSPTIDRLNHAHPVLHDRGSEALKTIPFTRTRVITLQQELAQELSRLARCEQTLGQLATLIGAGEEAFAEHNHHAAIRTFEQILAVAPECAAALDGLARCRKEVAEREAESQRVKALVREAQAAARLEDWEQVVGLCDRILAIDRTVPLAIALRQAGRSVIDTANREAESSTKHAIHDRIHTARAWFRRGHCEDALTYLRAFLIGEPTAAAVQIELNRLSVLAALRAGEAAARADEMQRRRDSARALLEVGALGAAVVAARQAVEFDPADRAGAILLSDAIEREGAARIEKERKKIAAQLKSAGDLVLNEARLALERGELVRAMEAGENAVRLSASSVEAMDFLSRVRAIMASDGSDDAFEDASAAATASPANVSNTATAEEETPTLASSSQRAVRPTGGERMV